MSDTGGRGGSGTSEPVYIVQALQLGVWKEVCSLDSSKLDKILLVWFLKKFKLRVN